MEAKREAIRRLPERSKKTNQSVLEDRNTVTTTGTGSERAFNATSTRTEQQSLNSSLENESNFLHVYSGEHWTARQRQMHPVHYTVSYRASFKPELPDFFIQKYLSEKGRVFDPFGGRGTTAIQANLLGHTAIHNDLNPVAVFLAYARKEIPDFEVLARKLQEIELPGRKQPSEDEAERLLPFFHERTLSELLELRSIILDNYGSNKEDGSLNYIALTALSRLHGHSDGFFSVYSFPQISVRPGSQRRTNMRRKQIPEYKGIKDRILKKMKRDLSRPLPDFYNSITKENVYLNCDVTALDIESNSVDLIVTSPPFLDKVDYLQDNWMRSWFLGLEEVTDNLSLSVTPDLSLWLSFMKRSLIEMGRVLKKGKRAVIEVGEIIFQGRQHNLEQELISLLPLQVEGGEIHAEEVYLNIQQFTKLANCWDIKNNEKGTNSNRCLVIRKE